ncbi:MAG: cysteine hydrolase family protein [Rubrimonas sp.]|uniref:cysteine hydrolase family protein n=1 Tax=Rubrimonas sp. TaxID=2036015 RepID=UPI002FDE1CA9
MPRQPTIVGNPVLLVIDIQASAFMPVKAGIPTMPGYRAAMERACALIAECRRLNVPTIYFQEAHRRDMIDYGRELDGTETIHCMEGEPGTPLADAQTGRRESDYFIRKRRYSCFFGTELEILLKGLKAQTLIMVGGMTDVCVHYTFADAHQHDYHCRVAVDAVGGTSPEAHAASLAAMEYLQTGANLSADEVVAALAARAARAA